MLQNYLKNKCIQESIVVFLLGVALAVYSLVSFYTATVQTQWILSPYLFPLLISVFAILLAVSLFAEGHHEVAAQEKREEAGPLDLKRLLGVVALCVVYYVLIGFITFIPATAIFLAALIWFLGERRPVVVGLVAALMPVILYVLFSMLLSVRLP